MASDMAVTAYRDVFTMQLPRGSLTRVGIHSTVKMEQGKGPHLLDRVERADFHWASNDAPMTPKVIAVLGEVIPDTAQLE